MPLFGFVVAAITLIIVAIYEHRTREVGCGTFDPDTPTLTVTTSDVSWGQTDGVVFGRILTANDSGHHTWSDWRYLYHDGCDDRERGKTDYYDDFADITDEWEALALYNCAIDGWALDSVGYWNGTHSNNEILMFCDNVAGPSVECYEDEVENANATCYPGFEDRLYDHVWIDQDGTGCPGITLNLKDRVGRDLFVGKIFPQSNPGIPDCSDRSSASSVFSNADNYDVDNNGNHVFTVSPNSLYLIIGLIAGLLLVNILCFGYKNCSSNNRSRRNKYAKVINDQVTSSDDDEAQHLNNV